MPKKTTPKPPLQVPFSTENGNMYFYDSGYQGTRLEYHAVQPFYATLCLEKMESTRASATTTWYDVRTSVQYPMILRYVCETFQNRTVDHGYVSGWWTFKKCGQNYTIIPWHDPASEVLT